MDPPPSQRQQEPPGAALGFREKSRRARDENEDVSNRGGREGGSLNVHDFHFILRPPESPQANSVTI